MLPALPQPECDSGRRASSAYPRPGRPPVLSPALAALAAVASDEGAVRQEGKPCVVDRAEDVVVDDRRLASDPPV